MAMGGRRETAPPVVLVVCDTVEDVHDTEVTTVMSTEMPPRKRHDPSDPTLGLNSNGGRWSKAGGDDAPENGFGRHSTDGSGGNGAFMVKKYTGDGRNGNQNGNVNQNENNGGGGGDAIDRNGNGDTDGDGQLQTVQLPALSCPGIYFGPVD